MFPDAIPLDQTLQGLPFHREKAKACRRVLPSRLPRPSRPTGLRAPPHTPVSLPPPQGSRGAHPPPLRPERPRDAAQELSDPATPADAHLPPGPSAHLPQEADLFCPKSLHRASHTAGIQGVMSELNQRAFQNALRSFPTFLDTRQLRPQRAPGAQRTPGAREVRPRPRRRSTSAAPPPPRHAHAAWVAGLRHPHGRPSRSRRQAVRAGGPPPTALPGPA